MVLEPFQHNLFDEDELPILGDLMLAEAQVPFLLTVSFECLKGLRKHTLLAVIVVMYPCHAVPTDHCPPLVDYSALLVDPQDFLSHASRPLSSYGLIPKDEKAGLPLNLQLDSAVLAYFELLCHDGKAEDPPPEKALPIAIVGYPLETALACVDLE